MEKLNLASKARALNEEEFIKQLNPADAKKFTEQRTGMATKWDDMPLENFTEREFGKDVTKKGWRELTKKLVDLGADDDSIQALKVGMAQIRLRFGDLFTAIGRNLDPGKEMDEFKRLFGDKFKTYLGATYDLHYIPKNLTVGSHAMYYQIYRDYDVDMCYIPSNVFCCTQLLCLFALGNPPLFELIESNAISLAYGFIVKLERDILRCITFPHLQVCSGCWKGSSTSFSFPHSH